MHINCGGKAIKIGNIKYEKNVDPAGAAKYVHVRRTGDSVALKDFGVLALAQMTI